MKTFLLTVLCASVASLSAFAGSCPSGGCGGKDKKKDKDASKESAIVRVME